MHAFGLFFQVLAGGFLHPPPLARKRPTSLYCQGISSLGVVPWLFTAAPPASFLAPSLSYQRRFVKSLDIICAQFSDSLPRSGYLLVLLTWCWNGNHVLLCCSSFCDVRTCTRRVCELKSAPLLHSRAMNSSQHFVADWHFARPLRLKVGISCLCLLLFASFFPLPINACVI